MSWTDNPLKLDSTSEIPNNVNGCIEYVYDKISNPQSFTFEHRTSDYAATSANEGKIWIRTDITPTPFKIVVATSSSYVVKEFSLSS